jgi:hypothetical protein
MRTTFRVSTFTTKTRSSAALALGARTECDLSTPDGAQSPNSLRLDAQLIVRRLLRRFCNQNVSLSSSPSHVTLSTRSAITSKRKRAAALRFDTMSRAHLAITMVASKG